MKKLLSIIVMVALVASFALAADEFDQARSLIQSKTPCNSLTESQLEEIGDYYMEQMHPGEYHVALEERLGGEGSATLKQAHLNIARMMYCGDAPNAMMMGTMSAMMGRSGGYGMMNNYGYGYGMMGNYGGFYSVWMNLFMLIVGILVIVALVLLIAWLIKQIKK